MTVIGDALIEETEYPETLETLLVRMAKLRAEVAELREDREYYRTEAGRQRQKARAA